MVMEDHSGIINELGGIRAVARMLGHTNHTTVQGWHERGKIPIEHWPNLVTKAREAKKSLTTKDLLSSAMRRVA